MSGNEYAPVVVGVDGSPESRLAVRHAAWEADQRRVPLRLVHGLLYPPSYGFAVMSNSYIRYIAEDAQGLVRDTEETVQREYPGLPVSRRVAVGGPAGILI